MLKDSPCREPASRVPSYRRHKPTGQAVVTLCCFSPRESRRKQCEEMRAKRKSKVQPSQVNRRKPHPKCKPGDCCVRDAYSRAIHRAIDLANAKREKEATEAGRQLAQEDLIPYRSPNQLRHTAATEIRTAYGLESVQAVLGHANIKVSEIYAEKNLALAAEIMRKIG